MPALRVFISSTMRDLDTERRLLRRRIVELNFEPVNAEDIRPTGLGSWARLERELESCQLMVLLQGPSYGWVPPDGPHGGEGKSITHLEYQKAVELDLPILVFQKVLDYEVDGRQPDAARRDAFRQEVGSWASGRFFAKWEHGDELPDLVVQSLVAMLSDEYQRTRIAARKSITSRTARSVAPAPAAATGPSSIQLPRPLVRAVAAKKAILFAGAGISLAAGLPSHSLFAARALDLVVAKDRDYRADRVIFARLADLLTALGERDELLALVQTLIQPPGGVSPTRSHAAAVRLFPRILTSNYDELFESELTNQGDTRAQVSGDLETDELPERVLVKMHGTVSAPETLLLGERQTLMLDRLHPRLWRALVSGLGASTVVMVGSSLRDISIVRLLEEVGRKLSGYYVSPMVPLAEERLLADIGLVPIAIDADSFFQALEAEVAR
jgi:hypothetical protein